MSDVREYVRVDEHGAMRVGNTRVMFDSVIAGFRQGHSPETIRQQYPALTLEEVYGSIAHYLAHWSEIDEYLRRQDDLWRRVEDESRRDRSPVVERLRNLAAAPTRAAE